MIHFTIRKRLAINNLLYICDVTTKKSRLKKLLKGVVVSSMATLVNTYGAEAIPTCQFSDNPSDDAADEYSKPSKDGNIKMLLHLNSDDPYALAGH